MMTCAAGIFQRIAKSSFAVARIPIASRRNQSVYVQRVRQQQLLKDNDSACRKALNTGDFAVFYGLKPLVSENKETIAWRTFEDVEKILNQDIFTDSVLLTDFQDNQARFAVNIADKVPAGQAAYELKLGGAFTDLRKILYSLSPKDVDVISQGLALLRWHSKNKFCSNCGKTTVKDCSGSKTTCTACKDVTYPQVSPVAISLVTDGDRCLLARQPQFPPGMYSALAGFIEQGETLEMTVKREVAEEVGLEVALEGVAYYSSQHWPTPGSSLMLACHAPLLQHSSSQIHLDRNELEEARWFSKSQIQAAVGPSPNSGGGVWIPPPTAIAHHLIKSWALAPDRH